MKTYELKFADGFKITVLATFDKMISMLDEMVQKHGDCSECLECISYNKYTGATYNKIW